MQALDREELQRFLIQAQAEGYYELFLNFKGELKFFLILFLV